MTKTDLARLRPLIAEIVEEKLSELIGDPDAGLALRPAVRARLRKTLKKSDLIPADTLAHNLDLRW